NPTDPGNGTNPTDPGNGTNPTDPGKDTDTGDNATSLPQSGGDSSSGENDGAQSPSDENAGGDSTVPVGAKDGNKLPNTATNLFNLGLAGLIALCAGWILVFRKRKA
ncbi:LPXTG cell wall anchor domain-containing protein, partial [Paenibacillus sp. ISL-20]|uniref:LPXTG cell wall anchor domain-containing protein n=1 Tax=Paenibacillus sp. ISL-20 TaxID=2819163 RepID=UPI001BE6A3B8